VPEFCPLLGRKFQELQRALTQAGDHETRLLSITLDPEFDRPDVLRRYAESLAADPARWTFATGDAAEVQKCARQFAIYSARNDAGSIDHTLATALIDPAGRVVEIWRGNGWRPSEVVQRLPATTPTAPHDQAR
jgi:protein SCO1/2